MQIFATSEAKKVILFFAKTYIEDNAQMLRALIASLPGQRAGR
jgi:hypothetical protein